MKKDAINYVVATIKDWNIEQFHLQTKNLPGNWHLFTTPESLTIQNLTALAPKYIFFPHWSWLVPEEILSVFDCICFHMTDVPYGRGGSPLQNLILRGHKDTKITALKMEKSLDTGPVYLKIPLALNGSAQEIFANCSKHIFDMIRFITELEPTPISQTGNITEFKRRTPAQSAIPETITLPKAYDFIRMLDADTYPKAFINHGDISITFSNAMMTSDNELVAQAKIIIRESDNNEK